MLTKMEKRLLKEATADAHKYESAIGHIVITVGTTPEGKKIGARKFKAANSLVDKGLLEKIQTYSYHRTENEENLFQKIHYAHYPQGEQETCHECVRDFPKKEMRQKVYEVYGEKVNGYFCKECFEEVYICGCGQE